MIRRLGRYHWRVEIGTTHSDVIGTLWDAKRREHELERTPVRSLEDAQARQRQVRVRIQQTTT